MATAISQPRPRSRYDHIFFQAFAAFIAVAVFLGFAQTYYMSGVLSGVLKVPAWKAGLAPPHPWLVHIHGVIFSSWILLLIVQTSLVARHRVDLHRRLGLATIGLACLLLLVGFGVSCESLARNFAPGDPRIAGAATNVLAVLIFSILVYFAYRERFNPAAHKRLIVVATMQLLPAAILRWPVTGIGADFPATEIVCYSLLFLLAGYDLWSTRNVHRATLWGIFLFGLPFSDLIPQSAPWRHFAIWMQTIGHSLR